MLSNIIKGVAQRPTPGLKYEDPRSGAFKINVGRNIFYSRGGRRQNVLEKIQNIRYLNQWLQAHGLMALPSLGLREKFQHFESYLLMLG